MTQNRVVSTLGDISIAGKNLLINGDFSIWSNGTTFSNPSLGVFVADRWTVWNDGSGATRAYSQQTFTPGTAPVAGYEGKYFVRLNQSVAGTSGTYNEYDYNVSNVRLLAGQTATISFWAKSSSVSTVPSIVYRQYFGVGVSATVNTTVTSSISLTNSWTRYSYTFPVPPIAGKTMDDTNYVQILFNLPLNATFTIDLWGVQLEAGAVATSFNTATGSYNTEVVANGPINFDGVLVSRPGTTSVFGTNGWAGYDVAGKNKIINGGFDYWQRGTSATSASGFLNTGFLADRWTNYYYGGGNVANYTVSQQAQTPGSIPGCETPYYVRHAFPAASSTAYWETIHRIEDVRTLAGQTITISFWARNSSATVAPNIELMQNFGTGGSTAVYSYPGAPPITAAWARYTVTTTLGSVSSKTIGAGSYLQFKLYWGPAGSSITAFNYDIAGVQIELGSTATNFSRAGGTIQGELHACKRYFETSYSPFFPGQANSLGSGTIGNISISSAGNNVAGNVSGFNLIPFQVQKRATPTVVVYDYDGSANAVRVYPGDYKKTGVTGLASILLNGAFQYLAFSSSVNSVPINGNLMFHWTADSEL